MKLESLALHHGYTSEETTKAAAVPIYQTTSYTFDDTQHGADLFDLKVPGNIYTRIMNPTTAVLEERIAAMEGGIAALAVASGMAAITYAIQCICSVGDNIISTSQLYGGTYNLFAHALPNQGIEARMIDADDYVAFEAAIDENTKAIFCESIGNPAGNVVDIQKLAEIGPKALIKTLNTLSELQPEIQDNRLASYAKKLSKEEAQIDWYLPAEQLERNIRAFNPWPVAFFILNNSNIKVYSSEVVKAESSDTPSGQIIRANKQGILVATGNQCLLLTKLQLPGKKPMLAADILNGRADWFAVGVSLI